MSEAFNFDDRPRRKRGRGLPVIVHVAAWLFVLLVVGVAGWAGWQFAYVPMVVKPVQFRQRAYYQDWIATTEELMVLKGSLSEYQELHEMATRRVHEAKAKGDDQDFIDQSERLEKERLRDLTSSQERIAELQQRIKKTEAECKKLWNSHPLSYESLPGTGSSYFR